MNPFLKWAGGKRWLIPFIKQYLSINFNNYIEPFLGGGAVYFYLMPNSAIISDINSDLINLYKVMRDETSALKLLLLEHQKNHCKEYYYNIRKTQFSSSVENAGQFLYLNRACYNGLYRVNMHGQFNVPIGTKNNFVYDLDVFDLYSRILKKASIFSKDFEETIGSAKEGDLIFVDPPYATPKTSSGFVKYNVKLFDWSDQIRLFNALIRAREKGAIVLMTNTNHYDIIKMYTGAGFQVSFIHRVSTLSGINNGRQQVKELIISS